MKQEPLKDAAYTLRLTPYVNNRPAIASAATIVVWKPGGEELIASTNATINGTTGELTYALTAGNNAELGENYVANWSYTIDGVVYEQTQLFDVVLNRLAITVVDKDLLDQQADIMERNESFNGGVESATTTTIVDADLKKYDDDFWNGGLLEVINPSTGEVQVRTVSDFVSSSGTVTVSNAWGTTPDNTYKYIVRRGFQKKIEKAFEEMMMDVRDKGFRPALILESAELHIPHTKKALELICRDYQREADDRWAQLADHYKNAYAETLAKVKFQYDSDESGTISGGEKDVDMGSLRMVR